MSGGRSDSAVWFPGVTAQTSRRDSQPVAHMQAHHHQPGKKPTAEADTFRLDGLDLYEDEAEEDESVFAVEETPEESLYSEPPPLMFKQLMHRQRRPSGPDDGDHTTPSCLKGWSPSKMSRQSDECEGQVLLEVREALNEHRELLTIRMDALMEKQKEVLDRLKRGRPLVRQRRGLNATPNSPSRLATPLGVMVCGESASSTTGPLSKIYKKPSLLSSKPSCFSDLADSVRRGEPLGDNFHEAFSPHSQVTSLALGTPRTPRRPDKLRCSDIKDLLWGERQHKQRTLDVFATVMIIANALLIGVETEYMTQNDGNSSEGFVLAQLIFNAGFMLELFCRLSIDRFRFFTPGDWKWNVFDSVLLLVSIADVTQVVNAGLEGRAMIHGRLMRIVRLSRVVRTLRVARALSYVHQFRKMIFSLQTSITTLGWSVLLLSGVMYAFAVIFVQGVAEYAGDPSADSDNVAVLMEHYGNMMRAYISLYKAISDGASWGLLMEPLKAVDDSFCVLFLVYISIVFFGVLNVVSAVFVESAMATTSHYKDLRIHESLQAKSELVRHMREVFNQIDKDMSGEISFEEMDHFLLDPQLRLYVESLEVTVEDTAMLFRLMDVDDSGVVDIDEFCKGLLRLQGDAKSFDVHLMMYEIQKFLKRWGRFEADIENMFSSAMPETE